MFGLLSGVGSSESVQLWIDSLTDDDWKGSNEEITGLYEHGVADYGNIELLLVPGTGGMLVKDFSYSLWIYQFSKNNSIAISFYTKHQ